MIIGKKRKNTEKREIEKLEVVRFFLDKKQQKSQKTVKNKEQHKTAKFTISLDKIISQE